MRRKIPFVAASLLALAVAFVTCGGGKKNSGDATGGKTVFVAGQSNNRATLWKNSAAQQLSGTEYQGYAASVFVSGDDVYAAGCEFPASEYPNPSTVFPVLWKNGDRQRLSTTGNYSWAKSIFVSGTDVYVAGRDGSGDDREAEGYYRRAVLWKNGTPQQLNGASDDSYALSVFVSDGDVYVAGFDNGLAALWKNGARQQLGTIGIWSEALSVFVSGGDVYVAGAFDKEDDPNGGAVLWKNGTPQELSHTVGQAYAHAVYVSGNDVYVTGCDNQKAVLWKNGNRQQLSSTADYTYAHAVYVSGGDVYVTGYEWNYPDDNESAVIWKNGTRQQLSGKNSDAYSVFVK